MFPHEVVGFSGGNKYLFPGVSGPEILNFFHWLGAVVTNPMIIGNKWTPVRRVVDRAAALAERVRDRHGPLVAQYGVPFAYKIRFTMQMNAREAMHLLELRTQEQGHTEYRRVCNRMYELIRDKAEHGLLAGAMKYIDPASYDLGRLHAEKRTHARLEAQAGV